MFSLLSFSPIFVFIEYYVKCGWFLMTNGLLCLQTILNAHHIYFIDLQKYMMNQETYNEILQYLLTLVQTLKTSGIVPYISHLITLYYNIALVYCTFIFSSSLLVIANKIIKASIQNVGKIMYYLYVYPIEYLFHEFEWAWVEAKKYLMQFYTYTTSLGSTS
jgi:hypothetical protein